MIKIDTLHAEKLQAAIAAAEGRAHARTISPADMIAACDAITVRLAISKRALEGTTAEVDINAQKFPNAYKYAPQSTIFSAIYKRGAWYLTDVHRGLCTTIEVRLHLNDAAKVAIIAKNTCFSL